MSINIRSNIASSETCQYIALLYYDSSNNICVQESSNYGSTFTNYTISNSGNQYENDGTTPTISMSSNGQYQAVCSRPQNNNLGFIWVSNNYGATWTRKMTDSGRNWISISVGSTGQYMIANINSTGGTYTSSNYGVTWNQTTLTQSMKNCTIPGSGEIMYTIDSNNVLYHSTNYGVNWTSFLNISNPIRSDDIVILSIYPVAPVAPVIPV